jgi:predicted ArsR family transcriptional regulator
LKVKIERESRARKLPALSEKIVELAQDHGRIGIKFISTTLETNRNTVKKHVQQLVKMGRLVRHGKGRGPIILPIESDEELRWGQSLSA